MTGECRARIRAWNEKRQWNLIATIKDNETGQAASNSGTRISRSNNHDNNNNKS